MTTSELKNTTSLTLVSSGRLTITSEQAAILVGINRGAVAEDRQSAKDVMTICGIVQSSLVAGQTYDYNNLCNQIKSVVWDANSDTKYSPAMGTRVGRGVQMALVIFADPVYQIVEDERTLANGRKQSFQALKRPNWKNYEGEKHGGEMTVKDENGKSVKVLAKGHPDGEQMVNVHADTVQSVFRALKGSDGSLLYPAKNAGGKKAKADAVQAPIPEKSFRTLCAQIRGVLQQLATAKKVIGHDGADIDPQDFAAIEAIVKEYDRVDEKYTEMMGADWRATFGIKAA